MQNFSLIEEVKMEAIDSNIYEAFLESAPQVMFQFWALLFGTGENFARVSSQFHHRNLSLHFFYRSFIIAATITVL